MISVYNCVLLRRRPDFLTAYSTWSRARGRQEDYLQIILAVISSPSQVELNRETCGNLRILRFSKYFEHFRIIRMFVR